MVMNAVRCAARRELAAPTAAMSNRMAASKGGQNRSLERPWLCRIRIRQVHATRGQPFPQCGNHSMKLQWHRQGTAIVHTEQEGSLKTGDALLPRIAVSGWYGSWEGSSRTGGSCGAGCRSGTPSRRTAVRSPPEQAFPCRTPCPCRRRSFSRCLFRSFSRIMRRELSGAGFSFGASKGTSRSGMMPSAWMERPDGV